MDVKDNKNLDNKETCIICGCKTPVDRNTHIDFRDYYVEGCGQLCRDCYKKLYAED